MIFVGIGFGAGPYFIDRNISNLVDEDELKTKQRREASFYGVHALFIRLAAILNILSINIIFTYVGWEKIDVTDFGSEHILGIQLLMSIFPAVALTIGVLGLLMFPLGKKRVDEIQEQKRNLNT